MVRLSSVDIDDAEEITATYGGHMELSAFAHLTQRHVKVIQPGLVYVISPQAVVKEEPDLEEEDLEPRRSRKVKVKVKLEEEEDTGGLFEQAESGPTLYVAYHDWEHFSSIRNLRGPHAGLPCVVESPGPEDEQGLSFRVFLNVNSRVSSFNQEREKAAA